jgi:hypothetical protein
LRSARGCIVDDEVEPLLMSELVPALVLGELEVVPLDEEPGAVVVVEPVADESVVEPELPIVLPGVVVDELPGVVVDELPGAVVVVVLEVEPGVVAVVPCELVDVDEDEDDCE